MHLAVVNATAIIAAKVQQIVAMQPATTGMRLDLGEIVPVLKLPPKATKGTAAPL